MSMEHQMIKDSHPWGIVLTAIGSFAACVLGGVGAFTLGWNALRDMLGGWGPCALLVSIGVIGNAYALRWAMRFTDRGSRP